MIKTILSILILSISLTALSQQKPVEAIYYDREGNPYKIERSYSNGNIISYVIHDNQGSVCIKQYYAHSGDTMILKEQSFRIFHEKTKLELFQECENWSVSSNLKGDTVLLKGFTMGAGSDQMILVGDTMLVGEAAKRSWDFHNQIKKARVPLILNGELSISHDSLGLNETVISYFIKGIPIKVEVFDSSNNLYSTSNGELLNGQMVWKRYFFEKAESPFQIDSVTWNADTTEITWYSRRMDETERSTITKYQIIGKELNVTFSDNTTKKIEYFDDNDIFPNLLIRNFIFNDVLYYSELRFLEREKIVRVSTKGYEVRTEYILDSNGQIAEHLSYQNGQLQKRVIYRY